jgi:membrane protein
MNLNTLISLLKDTFQRWQDDKVSRLAAALAYHTMFALAPLLIIAIGMAGLVFGRGEVQGYVMNQLGRLLDQNSLELIESMLLAMRNIGSNLFATLIGVVTLVFGASRVFNELQLSLNTIWGVKPDPETSIIFFIKKRLISFGMILGIGLLLLLAFLFITLLTALENIVNSPYLNYIIPVGNFLFITILAFILFGLIYKVLPDVQIVWKDVAVGAGITAVLFSIGQILIGIYLVNSSFTSSYGAAGSFLVLLVWVYYSAQILYFGAEITEVYTNRFGSKLIPTEEAVFTHGNKIYPATEDTRMEHPLMKTEEQPNLLQPNEDKTKTEGYTVNPLYPIISTLFGLLIGFLLGLPWKKGGRQKP